VGSKGQAEVMGALLLAVLVTLAFIGLWTWFYPRYLEWGRRLDEELLESEMMASERIVVERVKEVVGGLRVYLTNTGEVELEVVSIYVNDTRAWDGELRLRVGESVDLEVEASHGELYRIKVCSMRGNCWEVVERGQP